METSKTRETERDDGQQRRPYQQPAVQWEEDFEPYVFSTCGKMPAQGGACRASKNS